MKLTSLVESTSQYETLKKDCGHYLDSFKEGTLRHPIYRGAGSSNKFQKIVTRKNRTPVDTPLFFHDIADGFFFKRFSVKARSDSNFCSTSKKQAKLYGFPCGVVPAKNNYKFIYSPIIRDLYNDIIAGHIDNDTSLINKINPSIKESLKDINHNSDNKFGSLEYMYDYSKNDNERDIIAHVFLDCLKNAQYYMDNTLEHVTSDASEVMLICDEFYMIPTNSDDVIRLEYDYSIYL